MSKISLKKCIFHSKIVWVYDTVNMASRLSTERTSFLEKYWTLLRQNRRQQKRTSLLVLQICSKFKYTHSLKSTFQRHVPRFWRATKNSSSKTKITNLLVVNFSGKCRYRPSSSISLYNFLFCISLRLWSVRIAAVVYRDNWYTTRITLLDSR